MSCPPYGHFLFYKSKAFILLEREVPDQVGEDSVYVMPALSGHLLFYKSKAYILLNREIHDQVGEDCVYVMPALSGHLLFY